MAAFSMDGVRALGLLFYFYFIPEGPFYEILEATLHFLAAVGSE